MIILRDKNFAKVEKTGDIIRNEAEGICMEIIKTCRMYHSGDNNTGVGDQNIDHWLREEMENRYFKDIINSKAKDTTIVYAFLRNEDRNNLISRNERPANIIKDLTVSFGDEFIVDCIKKAERGGKYTKYLEGNKLHMNKEEIEELQKTL